MRSVLTIATGKVSYLNMAANLARSFFWWHPNEEISFYLATDHPEKIPSDVRAKAHIIDIAPNQYGTGFTPKLYLDQLAPTARTLFIDADCLITGNLLPVFEKFSGKAVSVVGGYIADGEWFGDIASICQHYKVAALPKFNGGIYYVEKGETASKVYHTARELEPQYDTIGFRRLRNKPNDEVLVALAMALHGQKVVADDGTIMSDPQACPGKVTIDVLRGYSHLTNPAAPHPQHQHWYPFEQVKPVVVHFLGGHTSTYPYTREVLKLKLAVYKKWPLLPVRVWAWQSVAVPAIAKEFFKNTFRPVYRHLFGYRKVKTSDRF